MQVPGRPTIDAGMYVAALGLYAKNLAVALPPLVAAIVAYLLTFLSGPITDPVGGAGGGIFGLISQLLFGFAFGVSVIFADGAWRHSRANVRSAWDEGRRKAGNIVLASLGFFFLIYVAQMVGGLLQLGWMGSSLLGALAVFGLIYTLPAASIGGVPAVASLNRSVQMARARPLSTAVLAVVSLFVYYYVGIILPDVIAPYGPANAIAHILLPAAAIGYVALVAAKAYADLAFSAYWR
ncbi:MAG: hypothetical protein M3Y18_07440 [Candidatus Eremiobacteraeota bacterium]|nr:hypothetical protein [Candidatus Eremiobacteraeota bacterium]